MVAADKVGNSKIGAEKSFFRPSALNRYMGKREVAVMPKLISPRSFYLLWIVVGALLAGTLLALTTTLPVYSKAIAVIVAVNRFHNDTSGEMAIVVFLPPEDLSRLRPNQRVFIERGRRDQWFNSPIVSVAPRITSPQDAERLFGLSPGVAARINEAKAIAVVEFKGFPNSNFSSADFTGSVYDAQVETGSSRLISLFSHFERFRIH